MKILGLTGSIGMGKSTTAAMFRGLGVPVFDADREVHRLLARTGAGYRPVSAAFAGVARADGIDRKALGARVFGDDQAMARLEAIVHPLVQRVRQNWLARQRRRRQPLVVLDVPLLFETGGAQACDSVVVVSASALLQRQRVLARPDMTAGKFAAILARQVPDPIKRRRADWVVCTGLGRRHALDRVRRIVHFYRSSQGKPAHARNCP